ncbi:MAG: hypothetical protein JW753_02610 [Dehalococcoidia bacterium]|nr:hypothetical protein [Dehalococcoidia bacterium]
MARELKSDLRAMGLTLEEAALGAALRTRLEKEGIEPADLNRCLDFWRHMAGEADARDIARAAFHLDEACQRTGMSPEATTANMESLEKEVVRLEAARQRLEPAEKELQQLEERRAGASSEVRRLEEEALRYQRNVDRLEKREQQLSTRVTNWEKGAVAAEERLAVAKRGAKQLAELGLPPDELGGFAQQLTAVAHKHSLKPALLRERLLIELEQLDKGLGLDSQVKAKRVELSEVEKSIQNEMETRERLRSEGAELRQQLTALQGRMAADQAFQAKRLQSYSSSLEAAGQEIHRALSAASSQLLADTQRMKDQALEVGRELGRYDATIQQNQPMAILANLLSNQDVEPKDAQFAGLWVLRRLRDWAKKQERVRMGLTLFVSRLESAISEWERWNP